MKALFCLILVLTPFAAARAQSATLTCEHAFVATDLYRKAWAKSQAAPEQKVAVSSMAAARLLLFETPFLRNFQALISEKREFYHGEFGIVGVEQQIGPLNRIRVDEFAKTYGLTMDQAYLVLDLLYEIKEMKYDFVFSTLLASKLFEVDQPQAEVTSYRKARGDTLMNRWRDHRLQNNLRKTSIRQLENELQALIDRDTKYGDDHLDRVERQWRSWNRQLRTDLDGSRELTIDRLSERISAVSSLVTAIIAIQGGDGSTYQQLNHRLYMSYAETVSTAKERTSRLIAQLDTALDSLDIFEAELAQVSEDPTGAWRMDDGTRSAYKAILEQLKISIPLVRDSARVKRAELEFHLAMVRIDQYKAYIKGLADQNPVKPLSSKFRRLPKPKYEIKPKDRR